MVPGRYRITMLKQFLYFLEENGLLRIPDIAREDELGFDAGCKVQKYVFLAPRFGLPLDYHYDGYMYGPDSSQLGDECFEIAESYDPKAAAPAPPLPATFNSRRFLDLVRGRDLKWLNVATTLIDQKPTFADNDELVDRVEHMKHDCSNAYVAGVLADLQRSRSVAELDPAYNV